MRRLLVVSLAAGLFAGVPLTGASAGPPVSAGDFAADCNDAGLVNVERDLRVHGGAGTLTRSCVVVLAEGATLTLLDATLIQDPADATDCCGLVVGDAQRRSRVRVVRSTILLESFVQLSPGCCAGFEPDRSEAEAEVVVLDSLITGTSVEVSASIAHDGGRAVVRRSVLEATDDRFGFPLTVLASLTGTGGQVTVADSVLVSGAGIRLETGNEGRTTALRNTFDAGNGILITTGTAGVCTSSANTPDVPCT